MAKTILICVLDISDYCSYFADHLFKTDYGGVGKRAVLDGVQKPHEMDETK